MQRVFTSTALPLAEAGVTDLFVPVVLILLGVAVLIGGIAIIRKWMTKDDAAEAAGGFSLGNLRDLVRQGKMTQEEFDRMKGQIVAATHRAAERQAAERDAARQAATVKPDALHKP